jgi:hypothetical protein
MAPTGTVVTAVATPTPEPPRALRQTHHGPSSPPSYLSRSLSRSLSLSLSLRLSLRRRLRLRLSRSLRLRLSWPALAEKASATVVHAARWCTLVLHTAAMAMAIAMAAGWWCPPASRSSG